MCLCHARTQADYFFVPPLEFLSEKLKLPDNISGITLLAIGNGESQISPTSALHAIDYQLTCTVRAYQYIQCVACTYSVFYVYCNTISTAYAVSACEHSGILTSQQDSQQGVPFNGTCSLFQREPTKDFLMMLWSGVPTLMGLGASSESLKV